MKKQQIQISGTGTNRKKAFTLVELIIVITILAILATIAFVSFSNYTKSARDANRVSTLTNIEKGLDIYSVQVGRLPIPENPQTFTGGLNGNSLINQGVLTQEVLQTLSSTPVDPVTGKEYTYSIFGNGKYYQIAGNLETELSQNLGNQAYANTFQTAKLIGNYRYDPSLPSLIIGSGTTLFSADTCFVVDGGTNTLENCTTKKSDLPGNTSDSSLVGYWNFDEENFTVDNHKYGGTNFFRDYSGYDNHAFNSGSIQGNGFVEPSQTEGVIGNAIYFTSGSLILGSDLDMNYQDKITISMIGKVNSFTKGPYPLILHNRYFQSDFTGCSYYPDVGACPLRLSQNTSINSVGWGGNGISDGPFRTNNIIQENTFHKIDLVFDINKFILYIDGVKKREVKDESKVLNKVLSGTLQQTYITLGGVLTTSPTEIRDLHGIIDEVKIYNRALTDEEILQQAKIAGF